MFLLCDVKKEKRRSQHLTILLNSKKSLTFFDVEIMCIDVTDANFGLHYKKEYNDRQIPEIQRISTDKSQRSTS